MLSISQDIQPLMAFNFGGDEVAHDAWVNSSACNELIENNPELKPDEYTTKNTILHKYFVTKVAEIANAAGLNLAGWEDGLKFNNSAIPRYLYFPIGYLCLTCNILYCI